MDAAIERLEHMVNRLATVIVGRPTFPAEAAEQLARDVLNTIQVQALADAMWQLLDDMGEQGLAVCLAAKARARVAFEPFAEPEALAGIMSLADAERIADLQ